MKVIGWLIFGFLVFATIASVYYRIPDSEPKSQFDRNIQVIVHRQGSITYLIFGSSNGLQVKNYTSDSLEFEFLHSPTKTGIK